MLGNKVHLKDTCISAPFFGDPRFDLPIGVRQLRVRIRVRQLIMFALPLDSRLKSHEVVHSIDRLEKGPNPEAARWLFLPPH